MIVRDLRLAGMDLVGSSPARDIAQTYGLSLDRAREIIATIRDEHATRAALRAALVDLTGDLSPTAIAKRRRSIGARRAREIIALACGERG